MKAFNLMNEMNKASDILIGKVKEFEGLRLEAYKDAAGVYTIGYGHTSGVTKGQVITMEEADAFLLMDIGTAEGQLDAIPTLPELSQCQWDALVDFVFNLGIGNFKSSTLFTYIRQGKDDTEIQAQFRRWVYAGNKKLEGLVKRRDWEAKRWAGEC